MKQLTQLLFSGIAILYLSGALLGDFAPYVLIAIAGGWIFYYRFKRTPTLEESTEAEQPPQSHTPALPATDAPQLDNLIDLSHLSSLKRQSAQSVDAQPILDAPTSDHPHPAHHSL